MRRVWMRAARGAVAADELGKEKMRAEKKEKERGMQTPTEINWRVTCGRRRCMGGRQGALRRMVQTFLAIDLGLKLRE